jgi:hypothetical protein
MGRRSPAPMLRPKPKHWHETVEPVAILRAIEIRSQVVQANATRSSVGNRIWSRQDRAHDPCDAGVAALGPSSRPGSWRGDTCLRPTREALLGGAASELIGALLAPVSFTGAHMEAPDEQGPTAR